MSKIKIDKNDKNRVLLTELLPYEVPMLFSNDGFYSIVSSGKHEYFVKKFKGIKEDYGIPFNYEIAKTSDGESRLLSIIHPINQLSFIDFYKKYESIIIHLCSKSSYSLRKISKVSKFYYSTDLVVEEEGLKDAEVEVEPDILDVESKIYRSYFTYSPIDLIYKFYDRNEYQRLEQRFNLLLEFDISKCFYHIYTHSVTWAIKDKETAKKNKRFDSFENHFDTLMQHSNYNETNGIVVGPEVSRIFAEIILQAVDVKVQNILQRNGIKIGIDYEIRRYVDDFFAFANDQRILEAILKVYKKELEFYKLFVNTSKTEWRSTPFISNIAVGKRQIKKLIKDFMDECYEKIANPLDANKVTRALKSNRQPYSKAQSFIRDFQCIVKQNNLTYDMLNKDVVRGFKRELVFILRDNNLVKSQKDFEPFLLMFLDILFYCYSLNINSSATFKMSQIIVLIIKFMETQGADFKHTIYSKLNREAEFVMTNYHRKTKRYETNIETLNLLIALKKLGRGYLLTEKKIREYFFLEKEEQEPVKIDIDRFSKLNYFQIITLLYYFDDNIEYSKLKENLCKAVVRKFGREQDAFSKAEFTCLFFDLICCPFVDNATKLKIVRESKYPTSNAQEDINKISEHKTWFMNWDIDIDLEPILKKKEWTSAY